MSKQKTARETFTVIDGPDEQGFYTAYNQDGGYAHLKADGKTPLYPERYEDIGDFHEGFAVVQLDHKGFHIRSDGQPAYEQRYDGVVMDFRGGKADVHADGPKVVLIKLPGNKVREYRPGSRAS